MTSVLQFFNVNLLYLQLSSTVSEGLIGYRYYAGTNTEAQPELSESKQSITFLGSLSPLLSCILLFLTCQLGEVG